ncbi:hypothetical protein GobsT_71020 [Gemmata obscuriglobus]|uniref:PEP-CTERM sorting domain-containing protein n=1 Tax=Gemmata obscuriglobus TaxID=114 RepID=A0A2Z3HJZ7_9BACT|nr:hypothetical protein [Gemmata obscuriglobus]AWM41790.1 hypothetical protein C1280_35545 [Gemmata obscuriglobus]QEG32249.1 hypothetical protein GobsT_71020 [Gemmata obscuriglobus]VTS11605.1 unnamed protein product [Gemmata obscuriglobus UQM 2246]
MFSRFASRTRLAAVAAAVALCASAGAARADYVDFSGSRTGDDPVSFSGRLTLGPTTTVGGTTTATLTVTLNNTTPTTSDAYAYGFITGFGFNVPTGVTASNPVVSDTDFKLLNAAANATNLQGGEFDYAFSTNSSQLHTVATAEIAKGIGAGGSATFQVTLTGSALLGLTAAELIGEKSAGTGSSAVPFSVRFRSTNKTKYAGYNDPDGDKVPVSVVTSPPPTPPSAIPTPPGVVLAGIGFGSLLLGRLRRAK